MNARLQMQLDGKMTLLEMVEHYETCLSRVRRNKADDDIKALQFEPFTAPDASILEIDAKKGSHLMFLCWCSLALKQPASVI